MNRLLALAAFGMACGAAAQSGAQETAGGADAPVVVELFTSQGCSACPPADEMMAELVQRDDVIGLSLHVDYWNYLGWADTFSQAAFTDRQYGYGRAAGSTVVYTPQIIVGGADRVMGARAMQLADLIAAHRAAPDPVRIAVSVDGEPPAYAIEARWIADGAAPQMIVQLVAYSPHEAVEIARGENAGRSADYYNVVRDWRVVAEWDGRRPFAAEVTAGSDMPHVVIVQQAGHGAILGAARLE
ncbi:DUF1223 domain-containing protein [Roseibacterium sp. SDUM158017]|uniref:DUF1223 domain-containing protein n=1 Tax=Roseicyclus salinarum TaxID=3036773 RepID=UPI0024150372|nr:DUF1223 domain-containing protein [Roseibacterium sp. SDUM158017]MDG4648038.1 DUF1223 domain-containing protein [Roseibacterium sp. SDUM158017]